MTLKLFHLLHVLSKYVKRYYWIFLVTACLYKIRLSLFIEERPQLTELSLRVKRSMHAFSYKAKLKNLKAPFPIADKGHIKANVTVNEALNKRQSHRSLL